MSRPVALRPIVDLDSGAVLAIEAVYPAEEQHGEDVATLAERLGRTAREVMARENLLPLVLPVPARLLTAGREPFAFVEDTLRRSGRRPRDVTFMLDPEIRQLPREHLVRGLAHLRELGFRYAFGTARVPPDLLVETAPFLFRIDGTLTSGLPDNERFAAIVDGMTRIGRGAGTFPLASGVTSVTQLVSLRQAGVRLAQGPFFAGEDWAPGDRVTPLPDLTLDPASSDTAGGPRVSEFMVPAVTMTCDATAEEVLEAFSNDSALNSVILLDHRERPVAALDRARFLLSITGPYGHALYAKRPAQRLADPPKTVPRTVPALTALRIAGVDRERVYDDLIAVNEFGQCMGVVHVSDIIRGLSQA
ncbi:EAL domain-containing protein [Thermobifida halotolerans]|uniref:EAL domain-containing protein n=1 Tax=Thermobifida halotolerans TaxID=483545 RepID=UPI001F1BEE66|nr:EAL domain-containing protein [Thermobifida halotolerans]